MPGKSVEQTSAGPSGEERRLSVLDRRFARFIADVFGEGRPEVLYAAALASASVAAGNICLDMRTLREGKFAGDSFGVSIFPSAGEWERMLAESPAVGSPGAFKPLILDRGRLYLYRYWDYQRRLADFICRRSAGVTADVIAHKVPDIIAFREKLALLFPDERDYVNWRKIAALTTLLKDFSVISGSPGTGKTTAVTAILALLVELSPARRPSIALAAPTGKAAARLQETVKGARQNLPCPAEVVAAIPDKATTIHRLLQSGSRSPYFRHNRENPLPFDLVVVDEASMVDLPLMTKLADALRPGAKLILLGDKDQLTSVEAGAVMGDICGPGPLNTFSRGFIGALEALTGQSPVEGLLPGGTEMNDGVVQLERNYRFGKESGIWNISRAVNGGDAQAALTFLKSGQFVDARWHETTDGAFHRAFKERIMEGMRAYLGATNSEDAGEIFALLDSFRILCALRQGPRGVYALNAFIEECLADEGLIARGEIWYPGRPVMVTRNDYRQRLFNGDVGILLRDRATGGGGDLRAFFRDPDGSLRKFVPLRLPEHETVYAMTVHKSQGSEFGRVLLVLPEKDAPVLTRELIYTGITRARKSVEIWGRGDVFLGAVSRRVVRASGLREVLWGEEGV